MQMDVAREYPTHSIPFRRVSIRALNLLGHGIDHGITELMSSGALARREPSFDFAILDFDIAEFRQALLHTGAGGEDSRHRPASGLQVDDRLREIHKASALGVHRRIAGDEFRDRGPHGFIRRQSFDIQLRVSAAQIDPIEVRRKNEVRNRAEFDEFRAQCL